MGWWETSTSSAFQSHEIVLELAGIPSSDIPTPQKINICPSQRWEAY